MTQRTRFDHFALGRLPAGVMNKTEQAYADFLELRKRAGEVLWWKFEGIKLRLADKTFLTPDFAIMEADCSICLDDIKGFMQEDANVKLKVAAEIYPFRFNIVRKGKSPMSWTITPVSNRVPVTPAENATNERANSRS